MNPFLTGFKKGMNGFGKTISVIINSILLAIVYIIGVGITSIACRLFRKQFLDVTPDKKAKTYWVDLHLKNRKIQDHYRQF